jgi:hypothetical protein
MCSGRETPPRLLTLSAAGERGPQTDPPGELFVGRIEHITSGTVFRFGSAAELTAFIARICDPSDPAAAEDGTACARPGWAGRRPLTWSNARARTVGLDAGPHQEPDDTPTERVVEGEPVT